MKRTILFFFLIVSVANAFLTASVGNAISEMGYTSKIDGVGLWLIEDNNKTKLNYAENPEFAMFCEGKNKLYIYEKDQQCFVCKTVKWDEVKKEYTDLNASDRKEMLKDIELAKKDKYSGSGQKNYTVLLFGFKGKGFYTVSKKRLIQSKWTVSPPTEDEMGSHIVSVISFLIILL